MKHASLYDYWKVLRENAPYRLAFISYCIDNVGNWLTFVASVSITSRIGGSLYTSAYLVIRLLPSFLFAGCVGSLADKWDKRWLMIGCALGSASAVSILLIPAQGYTLLSLIFVSASIQFTFGAMFEPVRNSLIPLMMSPDDLVLATTLDSIGWSTVGAFGAAVGGTVNSVLGSRMSFLIDIISYITCAILVYCIPSQYGNMHQSHMARVELVSKESGDIVDVDDTVGLIESVDEGEVAEAVSTSAAELASLPDSNTGSFAEGFTYVLSHSFVISLCLMKGAGALAWE